MNSVLLFIYQKVTALIPETRGFAFKRFMLRCCGAEIGENVRICSSASIMGSGKLIIGDNTWIGHRSMIIATTTVKIGSNCDIAPEVYIGNGTHMVTTSAARIAGIETSWDTIIGDGCWLGVRTIVLPGVSIAPKCVTAGGAVITHSVNEPMVMMAGIPAKIKKRY